jgi:hypothetical protein
MEYAKELIEKEGFSVEQLERQTILKYSSSIYYDLSVTKCGKNQVRVMQSYVQNGDLMSAPEVEFGVSGSEWTPIRYVNHEVRPQVYEYNKEGLGDSVEEFVEMWESNLRGQYPLDSLDQYREDIIEL